MYIKSKERVKNKDHEIDSDFWFQIMFYLLPNHCINLDGLDRADSLMYSVRVNIGTAGAHTHIGNCTKTFFAATFIVLMLASFHS